MQLGGLIKTCAGTLLGHIITANMPMSLMILYYPLISADVVNLPKIGTPGSQIEQGLGNMADDWCSSSNRRWRIAVMA